MILRRTSFWLRAGTAAALVLVVGGCTPGGQFDPTSIFANDMFDTKKKLQGDREPVFPQGVPGTTAGVPQDLYKGYQPPPDQAADVDANGAPGAAAAAAEPEKPKPKPKPKPKVATAPAPRPTRISVGPSGGQAAPAPQGAPAAAPQTNWPAAPQTAPAPQGAQPSQSPWPDPPKAQ
jgi:hypothetical protein